MNIKILITILSAFSFGHFIVLKALQIRSASNPIPDNVSNIYEPRTYSKWQEYHVESSSFYIIRFVIDEVLILLLLFSNAIGYFMNLFPLNLACFLLSASIIISVVVFISSVFSLHQLKIKEKYGLSKLSRKAFWKKQIKLYFIVLVLFLTGETANYLSVSSGQLINFTSFPLFVVLVVGPVVILAVLIPPILALWDTKPLKGEGLRDRLEIILLKNRIKNCQIRIKKTDFEAPANACYFRFFHRQYIILYDSLLLNNTTEEVEAIFAHEVGQAINYRIFPRVLQFAGMLIPFLLYMWYVTNLVISSAINHSSIDNVSLPSIAIVIFGLCYLLTVGPILLNRFSRNRVVRADEYAASIGYGYALKSCLMRIASEEFEELNPDPLLVNLEWGLPPLSHRLKNIDSIINNMNNVSINNKCD